MKFTYHIMSNSIYKKMDMCSIRVYYTRSVYELSPYGSIPTTELAFLLFLFAPLLLMPPHSNLVSMLKGLSLIRKNSLSYPLL